MFGQRKAWNRGYKVNSLVPRLYPRTQTKCNVKRGKAWDISSCDLTSDDVQVDRLYLVPRFYAHLVKTRQVGDRDDESELGS